MKNSRISKNDLILIKSALRRAFSRSDLRKEILEAGVVEHSDPARKRVKTWVQCQKCLKPDAKSNIDIDHVDPLIPVDRSLQELDAHELLDRQWCDKNNLQRLCQTCHNEKSRLESKLRRAYKKGKSK